MMTRRKRRPSIPLEKPCCHGRSIINSNIFIVEGDWRFDHTCLYFFRWKNIDWWLSMKKLRKYHLPPAQTATNIEIKLAIFTYYTNDGHSALASFSFCNLKKTQYSYCLKNTYWLNESFFMKQLALAWVFLVFQSSRLINICEIHNWYLNW